MTIGLISLFTLVVSGSAFANCLCTDFKNIGKYFKKNGYMVSHTFSSSEAKEIEFQRVKNGKSDFAWFWWRAGELEDQCTVYYGQSKMKKDGYDGKSKNKIRIMPTGSPDSSDCATLVDDAIVMVPPS